MVLSLLAGCMSIPIGDGKSMKLSKDGIKFKSENGEEQEISFQENEDGASYTVTGTDEEGEASEVSFGQTTEIPENFPEEIPVPDDAVVESAMNMDLGEMIQITIYLNAPSEKFDEYAELYRGFGDKTGYEKSVETTQDGFISLSFKREDEVVSVTINRDSNQEEELFMTLVYRQSDEEN